MPATSVHGSGHHSLLERELGGIASLVQLYTAQVCGRVRSSAGSGVVWRHDGLIVSTSGVARDPRPQVTLHDGTEVEGRVVARDEASGLALLWVSARGLLIAPPGDPWALRTGSTVLALNRSVSGGCTLSLGMVHSATHDDDGDPRWLASDINVAGPSLGGALVDSTARLVGINAANLAGLSTAVPVNIVQEFVREAEEDGRIPKRILFAA
jgi:S1-C subfamily serine protease